MPTATTFQAKGRRNGFPSCPAKVDVSEFSHWITLGGVDRDTGGATDEKINESLKNAMQIWWNLYSSKGSFSASAISSVDGTNSVSATDHEVILKRFIGNPFIPDPVIEEDPLVPFRRACFGTVRSGLGPFSLFSLFKERDDSSNNGQATGIINCGNASLIARMYNGSTDDEDNFVGYGVSGVTSVQAEANVSTVETVVAISVGSFLMGTDFGPTRNPDVGNALQQQSVFQTNFQTNLGEMPFRSVTFCQAVSRSTPESELVSATELSGTASASFSSEAASVGSGSATLSASIESDSLDFWTYS